MSSTSFPESFRVWGPEKPSLVGIFGGNFGEDEGKV